MQTPHQVLTERLTSLERATSEAVASFAMATAGDDRRVLDHVARVAHLAVSVGLLCGVREPHLSVVERAAMLHHVTQVPARDILRTFPAFASSVNMIAALPRAHEPNPADGKHTALFVPFGARIIALCDRFDEIRYTRATPIAARRALAVLRRERAARVNREIIDALAELIGEKTASADAAPQGAAPTRARRTA